MTTYSLFVDEWNSLPAAYKENFIIARCMDDAVQSVSRLKPDRIVIGNTYFEKDFIDWLDEHGGLDSFKIEFVKKVDGYEHRNRINEEI